MQTSQNRFILHSEYAPTGDQPQAIEKLVKDFREGNQCQTLLGVTGSGKTFTMANVIQALNKPMAKDNKERVHYIRKMSSTVVPSEDEEKDLFSLANRVPFDDRINLGSPKM